MMSQVTIDKSSLILKVLLNNYHGGAIESITKRLPEEEKQKLNAINVTSNDPIPVLSTPLEMIKKIHYSWLLPQIEKIPKDQLILLLSLFPEEQRKKLNKTLGLNASSSTLSERLKKLLFNQLFPLLELESVTPIEYLPTTEMKELTGLSKAELVEMIDFLGLYDLAEEIKQIIDKNLIKKIYKCLSEKKHLFLRECLHKKDKLITQRLQLENWDGDYQKLLKLLHHRGMIRLGYALSGQPSDLIWHITHTLDTGRGRKLVNHCQKDEIPGVSQSLRKDVRVIMSFLKRKNQK